MKPTSHSKVYESYLRCYADPDFLDTFYKYFFKSSPEIAQMFRLTDLTRQKQMLKDSLGMLLMYGEEPQNAGSAVEWLARKHGKTGLKVKNSILISGWKP